MKLKLGPSLHGIKMVFGENVDRPPERGENVNQTNPRRSYVYAHIDPAGNMFYIGKGKERRAWSNDRHHVWHRYVQERCNGNYTVEILIDNLSPSEADEVEAEWIEFYGKQLVNCNNPGRDIDLEASNKYHQLRDANRKFVEETKPLEITDPDQAIARYREALVRLDEYESLIIERGLVAELSDFGGYGEPKILDRLTLCLEREYLLEEALQTAKIYFQKYPLARESKIGKQILKRVEIL
jgi:hypothetical protein